MLVGVGCDLEDEFALSLELNVKASPLRYAARSEDEVEGAFLVHVMNLGLSLPRLEVCAPEFERLLPIDRVAVAQLAVFVDVRPMLRPLDDESAEVVGKLENAFLENNYENIWCLEF